MGVLQKVGAVLGGEAIVVLARRGGWVARSVLGHGEGLGGSHGSAENQ